MKLTTSFASGRVGSASDTIEPDIDRLVEISAEHAPEGGYGETYLSQKDGTVWWNAADWSSIEEIEAVRAAFLTVPGITDVVVADEAAAPEGWEQVWVPKRGSEKAEEALMAELTSMAAEPLELDEAPAEEPTQPVKADRGESLRAAAERLIDSSPLSQLMRAHQETLDTVKGLFRDDSLTAAAEREHALTAAAISALTEIAGRPQAKPSDIHVHIPEREVSVEVAAPEFKPEITIEAAAPPPPADVHVDVHVPEQKLPEVHVAAAVPEVIVQPGSAPEVHVHVPDEIRTIPAETETVAERDADDLIVRSVTRPTGE